MYGLIKFSKEIFVASAASETDKKVQIIILYCNFYYIFGIATFQNIVL